MEAGTGDQGPGAGERGSRIGTDHARATGDPPDARLKRLRWRCRRGTRELDALLSGWLEMHGAGMDEAQFATFDALLDRQDPELWSWLTGHSEPPRAEWREIVADIRRRAGLAP